MPTAATAPWDWIVGLTFVVSFFAALGNGANDVANSYATSVAAKTLKMWQVGILAIITEFIGAVVLGSRVTDTVKNGIISPDRFQGDPAVFMLAMSCAEVGNASWLWIATKSGLPVSTTQTVVGAIVGVGIATQTSVSWAWEDGSVSQIAASWGVAPAISCAFAALIFGTIKYSVLIHGDQSLKWALRLIPLYLAFTGGVLALFITVETPTAPSLEDFGAGRAVGVVLGVFFGLLAFAYIFFVPYLKRRLVQGDARLQWYHIPIGPLMYKENPPIYFPSKNSSVVENHYEDAYGITDAKGSNEKDSPARSPDTLVGVERPNPASTVDLDGDDQSRRAQALQKDLEKNPQAAPRDRRDKALEPYDRFVRPIKHLPWSNPRVWWGWFKFVLLHGVTKDVVSHDSALLRSIHAKANRYDDRVEHCWTYCQVRLNWNLAHTVAAAILIPFQVASAILMSIAHGANDVANAIGPLVAVFTTWRSGQVNTETDTPIWILAMAGIALGLGFWFFGYHIVRAVGNRITQFSPTRGFSAELGAAITVLLAARLGLPVSTTQCLVGASIGVALMNFDLGAVNWRQLAWIFMGWVLTLPCAALISGLIVLMAINTPRWDMPV